jgi:hypothetical protein
MVSKKKKPGGHAKRRPPSINSTDLYQFNGHLFPDIYVRERREMKERDEGIIKKG